MGESMNRQLQFSVLALPNASWDVLLKRFKLIEDLGFDLAGTGDHFVDWSNPPSPWFDSLTFLAAIARETTRIRLAPYVAQIPLREPAMLARQAITLDHISGGRLDVGLGIGLEIDPSYDIMGIPNWGVKERVARFKEYVEIVDQMLSNEITTYQGKFYRVTNAHMNPRPLQKPRPPIVIAAMGPVMLKHTVRYADTWNSLSFAATFEEQLEETRGRIAKVDKLCEELGRDPASLRRSYLMFDPDARRGGLFSYYKSEEAFVEMVQRVVELGITDIGLYYPVQEEQLPMFETIARDVIPELRVGPTAS